MDGMAESFIAFIERNQDWLPLIMVVFAAAETTAFLSILIPSTAVLVAVGALAATDAVAFLPLWIGATIGAMIGSFFSYWLGWRFGPAMLEMPFLQKNAAAVAKAQGAFAKYGPATIIIGHFTTILRPVVFLLAGLSGMSLARFALWNTLGCMAWAYLIPKLGEFGGDLFGWLWSLF
jgi:membrane protein DedA with SNARE-associated domain